MFDKVYVRPTIHTLIQALEQAQDQTQGIIARENEQWTAEITSTRGQPGGNRIWHDVAKSDRGVVQLAWWTDATGGRHFRVRGWFQPKDQMDSSSLPDDVPLLHVYPEVCLQRRRGKTTEWVALCGCGHVEPVHSSNWMGPLCRTCWDSTTPRETDRGLTDLGRCDRAHALADGSGFVLIDRNEIHITTQTGKVVRTLSISDIGPRSTVSPDGRHLAYLTDYRHLVVRDLTDGRLIVELRPPKVDTIRYSRDGEGLIAFGFGDVHLYDRDPESGMLHLRRTIHTGRGFDWHEHGWLTLVRAHHITVTNLSLEQQQLEASEINIWPIRFSSIFDIEPEPILRWSSEDHRVVCLRNQWRSRQTYNQLTHWRHIQSGWMQVVNVTVRDQNRSEFSPDIRWIVGCERLVILTDAVTGADLGALGWEEHTAGTQPGFTADGRSVLLRRDERAVVVPWRTVLGLHDEAGQGR